MKTVLLVLSLMVSATSQAKDLLVCSSDVPGAPHYSLSAERGGDLEIYKLSKHFNNPTIPALSVSLQYSDVIRYGSTTIVTANLGRSGYVHFYHNGQTSVIDINRFQNTEMNTDGALTGFTCVEVQ